MRKPFLVLLSGVAVTLGTATASADDLLGVYAGAGVVKAKVDHVFDGDLDLSNTSWKAILGIRPISLFAAEVNYVDLGSQARTDAFGSSYANAKAFAAYGVGFLPLPLPFLDLYAKLGLARWQLSGDVARPSLFTLSNSGTEFAWGAGAQVKFERLGARLEYEHFNIPNTDGAKIITLGATVDLL